MERDAHDTVRRGLAAFRRTLAHAVATYGLVAALDDSWRGLDLAGGRPKCDPDAMRRLYQPWLEPCARLEAQIAEWERTGHRLDLAERMREYPKSVEWTLASHEHAVGSDELAELRDDAIDAHS